MNDVYLYENKIIQLNDNDFMVCEDFVANSNSQRLYIKERNAFAKRVDDQILEGKLAELAACRFLNEEFGVKIDVPSKADLGALVKVERQIVDILNSKLDFTDMINFSLPQLWFIKLKINSNGEIGAPVIQHSSEIKKAKLRSKNSPGHFVDRLGFQI